MEDWGALEVPDPRGLTRLFLSLADQFEVKVYLSLVKKLYSYGTRHKPCVTLSLK